MSRQYNSLLITRVLFYGVCFTRNWSPHYVVPRLPFISCILYKTIFLSTLFSDTLNLPCLVSQIKSYTRTQQDTLLSSVFSNTYVSALSYE
jgi:hypothetical protein